MKAIYKYPLPIAEKHTILLPAGARIIRVQDVDGFFFLWAIVDTDPDHPTEERHLEFYKTGQPMDEPVWGLEYIGQCRMFIMQELMLYVFERVKPNAPYTT